jgi:type IV pilus assembly protein PilB
MGLKEKILTTLRESNLASQEDLDKALSVQKESGESLGQVLVRLGIIDEKNLMIILSKDLGIPPVEVSRFKIPDKVLQTISPQIAKKYKIIPVGKLENTLTVAMGDPLNIFAVDDLERITGLEINPVLASMEDINASLDKLYGQTAEKEIENILDAKQSDKLEFVTEKKDSQPDTIVLKEVKEGPVVKTTNLILNNAIKQKASDVLIERMEKKMRIRFRLDGILREAESPPVYMHPLIISRIKVMANLNIAEHRRPQDGRFRMKVKNRDVDFRVSIVPSVFGERAALRILDKSNALLDLDVLGFEKDTVEKIKERSLSSYGMIISCGPTGSGKTTSLYSILKYIDSPQKNIITVEDPIEYELKGINQVQVKSEVGLTFVSSLRSILRQDPDIVMVGEIRDYETVDIAIKAALTGHLVLSTVHTTTAAGAVTRFVNMGVEPFLVTSSVLGVIAQRLIRKLCDKCKQKAKITDSMVDTLRLDSSKDTIYKPGSCPECNNTGYKGRLGICEFLDMTTEVKELISKSEPESGIKAQACKQGMRSLREAAILKLRRGLTSAEEVLRVTAGD